jgi:hypothetical protein
VRSAFTRRSLVLLGIALLVPCLLGTTYKWTDAQGQVHFTDTPPPAGVPYEAIGAPHGPTPAAAVAPPTVAPAAEPQPAAVAPALPVDQRAVAVPTDVRNDARCVEALFQLQLLVEKYKVYKGPDDARRYLDDADRPAEIERLTRVRDESCSEDPQVQGSQQRRAAQLFQTLHPQCREARERLANLQRPSARSSPGDIELQRDYIIRSCPEIPGVDERTDLWRADWVWYRRRY